MTTCQPSLAMRPAISISSSLGVKSTRRLTKLKRTPRTPAACSSCSSSSVTLRRTVATPRALPLAALQASTMARLSAPWQVACTMTLRAKPRWSRSANSCCLLASQGVYLRSGANGNSSPGPKTWQWASTAPAGTWNLGLEGPAYQSSQPGVFSKALMFPPSVDVTEAGLFKGLAHLVHVQAQHAGSQLGALFALEALALLCGSQGFGGLGGGHADHAVIVGHDHVARRDPHARADHGDVDRAQRGLDRALGGDGAAPHGEVHFLQRLHVAHAGVDDQRPCATRLEARGQQVAEVAVRAFRGHGRDHDVAGLDLLCGHMHHPVVTGLQQHGDGRARDLLARIDGAHIGLEQAHAAHGLVDGGRAQGSQAVGGRAVGTLDRSEEHTSELQSPCNLVCRLLLEKKKK